MTRSSRCRASSPTAPGCGSTARPAGRPPLDENADPTQALNADSLETIAIGSNKGFQADTRGRWQQRHVRFPGRGQPPWAYWGAQLQALKPDLIATLNG